MRDVVAELEVGLKDLAAEPIGEWSGATLSGRVRDLARADEALRVQLVRTIAEWDRNGAWGLDGAVTPVAWLRTNTRLTRAEASGLVRLGRLHRTHPSVADALDGATITLAHARLLARAETGREVRFAEVVDGFVELAADHTVAELGQVLDAWVELVDDRDPDPGPRRKFRLTDSLDQAVGELVTSPEEAAIIRAALEALDTPDPMDAPEGPRTTAQRHHDLVIDIFRRALQDELGDDPSACGGVDVIVDAGTAAELTADPEQKLADLDPLVDLLAPYRDHAEGLRALRRCHHPDGRRATRAFAAALLCSGWIRRLVRDPGTGRTLDYGRARRRFSPLQRRALVVRDGGCAFPGCDRPPAWCDAHHLRPWDDDGRTDLENGVLLCRRHHVLVHRGWALTRNAATGVVTAVGPDGRELTRRPQERCRP